MNIPIWKGAKYFTPGRTYKGTTYPITLIIDHWMDGTLASTGRVFSGETSRQVSSHYGIGADGTIHQYVSEADTAWGAGDWFTNLQAISIEHEGRPGFSITDACYESSIALHTEICKKYGLNPMGRVTIQTNRGMKSFTVLSPHSAVVATECPGTLDIGRIRNGVLIDLQKVSLVPASSTPVSQVSFAPFNMNLEPSQQYSDEVKRMQQFLISQGLFTDQGNEMGYYGKKTQQAVDAFQKAHGILGASEFGWWYAKTRAVANQIISNTHTA